MTLQQKLHNAASLLTHARLVTFDTELRGVAYVEGVGMFILRDAAYGVRDLDIEKLQKKYPGKLVYFIGPAEQM